MQYYTVYFIW